VSIKGKEVAVTIMVEVSIRVVATKDKAVASMAPAINSGCNSDG
jgi:hypothetical protein